MRRFKVEMYKATGVQSEVMNLGSFIITVKNRVVNNLEHAFEQTPITEQPFFKTKEELSGLLCVEESNKEVCFMLYLDNDLIKVQPLWSINAMSNLHEVHKMVSENHITVKDAIGFIAL